MREFIIIIIILVIIFLPGILILKYLDNTTQELSKDLEELKEKLKEIDNKNDEVIEISNNIYNKWKNTEKKWSIIVLHDELDLIEIEILETKSAIEANDLQKALTDLEVSIFLIEHIQEKERVCLKNIF